MAIMCQVNENEILKTIPVMLTGEALLYYYSYVKHCVTCEEAINAILQWYKYTGKRWRILTKWESMRFTEDLSNSTGDPEVEAF